MTCDCPDKIILAEGDAMHIASESWCKVHGYETSCPLCRGDYKSWLIERCTRCRLGLKEYEEGK